MTYRTVRTGDSFKKVYICDFCNTEYANKEDAQKCENEHIIIDEIWTYKICAHQKYPHEIEVCFADGTHRWYKS